MIAYLEVVPLDVSPNVNTKKQMHPDYIKYGVTYHGVLASHYQKTDSYDDLQDQRLLVKVEGSQANIDQLVYDYTFVTLLNTTQAQALGETLQPERDTTDADGNPFHVNPFVLS